MGAGLTTRPRRVVLLGEGVAHGYPFAPGITLAGMLEGVLRRATPLLDLEVIDRSAVGLTLTALAAMVVGLADLEPDAVVLFAGNNWLDLVAATTPATPTADTADTADTGDRTASVASTSVTDDRAALAAAVRDGGIGLARALPLDLLESRVCSLLTLLHSCVGDTPVTIVVPEFNLADWVPDATVPVPVLAGDHGRVWMQLRDRAEAALADGRPAEAEALASEMVFRDGGTSAVGCRLIARRRLLRGDLVGARTWFENARDAPGGTLVPVTPRCPRVAQDALRTGATRYGWHVVDLPAIFAGPSGALPDRDLFVDHCHLSVAGLRLVVAAIAGTVGRDLIHAPLPADLDAIAHSLPIDPHAAARGEVMAAIDNACRHQPVDIVAHHAVRALASDPGVTEGLIDRLDAMCREPDRCDDLETITTLADALADAGVDVADRVVDLLGDRTDPEATPVHDVRSTFRFTLDAPGTLHVRLTCRVPGAADDETVKIGVHLAGHLVTTVPASAVPTTHDLEIPASVVRRGINALVLAWQPTDPRPSGSLEELALDLERGDPPRVLPVFGLVSSLTVHRLDPTRGEGPVAEGREHIT